MGLAGALVAALVFTVAILRSGGDGGPGGGGLGSSPAPSPTPTLSPTPAVTLTPSTAVAVPLPTPGPPTFGAPTAPNEQPLCGPDHIALEIGSLEGAAGSVFAEAKLTNRLQDSCLLDSVMGPRLSDPSGVPVADSTAAAAPTAEPLELPAGETARAVLQWVNWCGKPLDDALLYEAILPDGSSLIASYGDPTPVTPPCTMPESPSIISPLQPTLD